MAKYIVQIVILGTQALGKAFGRALRQEYQASQEAASRRNTTGAGRTSSSASDSNIAADNMRMGISLDESRQILNLPPDAKPEQIRKQFDHLFEINDKTKGGSFYLQSKVVRAHERILRDMGEESSSPKPKDSQSTTEAHHEENTDASSKQAKNP